MRWLNLMLGQLMRLLSLMLGQLMHLQSLMVLLKLNRWLKRLRLLVRMLRH